MIKRILLFSCIILPLSLLAQINTSPNGDVTIGDVTPMAKLTVMGRLHVEESDILVQRAGSPGISLVNTLKTNPGEAKQWTIYNMTEPTYGNSLQFWAYDQQGCNGGLCHARLTIQDNGFVGIGTMRPKSELAVAGTITTQKVKVTLNDWADFVFDPTYTLPSLGSLEAYIKVHKHLPEIPSEQTISREGLDLSEMAKLQMQKIEELTLYIIQQQKEINELKATMKNMQHKLDKQ
ncbi:hypothetical protein SAMN05444266_106476 [Chitinophaga jiangningensis]|uniref:DUF4468 domain-containing protein n=1 Tax=Chitinophaga jiangningensis TaxID=1419482 RepID=A0A1M7GA90_9BACT|nr:hypothetical protein [Chitinophaga jiangningensis]SHM13312.1 hypothetical protein SAMN05444266_106476 [Chitinophaga jiangningensis]